MTLRDKLTIRLLLLSPPDLAMGSNNDSESLIEIPQPGFRMLVSGRFCECYQENQCQPLSIKLLLAQLKEESSFVDVEAHYGYYSLSAATRIKRGKILAIEAGGGDFELLCRNTNLNNFKQIESLNVRISDGIEESELNITQAPSFGGRISHPSTQTIEQTTLPLFTLDALLRGKRVDFIRINTAGNALNVLKGCRETLTKNPHCRLIVEFNPKRLQAAGCEPHVLLASLADLGFEIYFCDDSRHQLARLPAGRPAAWEPYVSGKDSINLWCAPAETSLFVSMISSMSKLLDAESPLLPLAEKLIEQGAFFEIIQPEDGNTAAIVGRLPAAERIIPKGCPLINGPGLSRTQLMQETGRAGFALAAELMISNPHVVLTGGSMLLSGALAAFLLDKPHCWYIEKHETGGASSVFDAAEQAAIFDAFSNHIFCQSEQAAAIYKGFPPGKVSIACLSARID